MPDEGAIIGKVAVKVIPDTSKFKDELKAQLEKIEHSLKDVKIKVQLDGKHIKEEAEKVRAEAEEKLKEVKLKVDMDDTTSIKAAISRLREELRKLGDKSIRVTLNKGAIEEQMAVLEKRLKKTASITLRVNPKSQESIRRAIDHIDAELERLREKEIKVKLDAKSLKAEREKLQKMFDKVATLDLRIKPGSAESAKRAIAQIDAELEKMAEIDLKVKMDEKSLQKARAKLQKVVDKAEKTAQDAAEKALQDGFKRSQKLIDDVQRQLDDIKFAPGVDKAKLAETKREIETALIKIEELNAKIKVELDPLAKRRLELEVEELRARIATKTASIKPQVEKKGVLNVEAAMKVLTRTRDAVVKPVINSRAAKGVIAALDRISGYRDGREFVQDLKDTLFNLDLLAPKLAKVGLTVGGIGAAALSAGANLFAMVSAIGSIAGAGLALPGILGGLALGVIATSVVLKDFNKQFSQFQVGLGRKLKAGSAWKQLQQVMSKNFWIQAKKPMQDMLINLFPKFSKGMTAISSSLGLWFGNMSKGFSEVLGPRMAGMFYDLNQSILTATLSTGGLAQITGVLGSVGAAYLPRLAQWFTNIVNAMADWLTKAEKTGELVDIIDRGIEALKALFHIGADLVLIFNDISRAAQKALGENVLTKFARGLDKVHKATASANFQKNLVDVFRAAEQAMKNIYTRVVPELAKTFSNLAKLIKATLPNIGATIGELVAGILDAFNQPRLLNAVTGFFYTLRTLAENLRPAWKAVGDALGAVLELVTVFVDTASPGAARAIENLAGWISTLADGLKPLVEGLGGALNDALDAVAPGITKVIDAIAAFGDSKGGKALVGFFHDLVPLLKSVADWLGRSAEAIGKWADKNLPKLRDALKPIIANLKDFFDKHGDAITKILLDIGDAIVVVVSGLGKLDKISGGLVTSGILVVLAAQLLGISKAIKGITTALEWFGLGKLKGPLALIGAVIGLGVLNDSIKGKNEPGIIEKLLFGDKGWAGIQKNLTNTWNNITGWFKGLTNWFDTSGLSGVPGLIGSFLFGDNMEGGPTDGPGSATGGNAIGTPLYLESALNKNKGLIGDFATKVSTKVAGFRTTILGIWNNLFGGMDTGTKNGMGKVRGSNDRGWSGILGSITGSVVTMGGKVKTGFDGLTGKAGTGIESLLTTVKGIPGRITTALGDLKTLLLTRGWNLINGLTGGASGGFGGLVTTVKSIPGRITSALGDLKNLLLDAGSKVIGGFISGLESKWTAVKKSLGNLTSLLPSWKGPANRDAVLLHGAGQLVINGFIDGLESRYDAVKKSLGGLSNDVGAMSFGVPAMGVSGRLRGLADGSMAGTSQPSRVLNYYAAPGSSISAEEDLFAAAGRSRMGAF